MLTRLIRGYFENNFCFIADDFQLSRRKQPLSLLATAIRILEKKPKERPAIHNGHLPNNYAKQVRPRSAYVVLKKPTQSSSTLNSSKQNGSVLNGMTPKHKQLKTKQNLYMSLIHPSSIRDPKYGMTVPTRIRTPMDYHLPPRPPKANTLPRHSTADGKRLRVNRKLYMDMIRPVMTSPQYLKLGASRSTPPLSLTQKSTNRQTQAQHTRNTPRPPSSAQNFRRFDPNLSDQKQRKVSSEREQYRPRIDELTPVSSRAPLSQRHNMRYGQNSSLNNSVSSTSHRDLHLPRITRKTKDDVSLNSSLNSRSQIPRAHPDNIKPLYFRKSLAYSPSYERKDLLSNPLSSMNN